MEVNLITLISVVIVLVSAVGLLVSRFLKKAGGDEQAPKVVEAVKEEEPAPKIVVYYGTQTGTAEGFAKEAAEKLKAEIGVGVLVEDLADVGDEEDLKGKLLQSECGLFLCSTYGDGEPPDTVMPFFERMEAMKKEAKDEDEGPLTNLKYSVFALGSTQYEHYCNAGKDLDKLLGKCGASQISAVALGDDDEDIDADFNTWLDRMVAMFREKYGAGGAPGGRASLDAPPPSFDVQILQGVQVPEATDNGHRPKGGYDAKQPFKATMVALRELHTSASDRSCIHVEVDLRGSGLKYETGDHIGVYGENSDDVVHQIATRLNVDPTAVIQVSDPAKPNKTGGEALNPLGHSGPLTVYTALSRYCDLLSPLKKGSLNALAKFASNPTEAARLRHLASPEGKAEYNSWVVDAYRSVYEVLMEFPSCQPPLGAFFCSIVPRLLPRYYSISSSALHSPHTPSMTVAVVQGATGTGRMHNGVCSTWLGTLKIGVPLQLPVFIRSSNFRLPKRTHTPVVMIGPGTGLAPFRGFIQERTLLQNKGEALGIAYMFFGLRDRKMDFIYQDELEGAEASGAISSLVVATSREPGTAKEYVQHKLGTHGAQVISLLTDQKQKGHLYVCGATQMAKDVHAVLQSLLQSCQGMAPSEADAFLARLTSEGRYSRDVW